MRMEVRTVNLSLDAATRNEIGRRFATSLDMLARGITRVYVRFVDENGPRGGRDISCLVDLRLRPAGRLFVETRDADLASVVNRAVEKAATAASRALERSRGLRRRPRLPRAAAAQACLASPTLA